MFLYLGAEQTLSVIGTGVYTLVLILRQLHFHILCRELITEQASPILRRTSRQQ